MTYLYAFPLIAPADNLGYKYRGFFPIHQKEYYIEIHLANTSTDQCQDIGLFLSDLKATLEQICAPLNSIQSKPLSERFNVLYKEINEIGFDKLISMDDTMENLIFKCQDNKNRSHSIKVQIPPYYPLQSPVISIDLPVTDSINDTNMMITTTLLNEQQVSSSSTTLSLPMIIKNSLIKLNSYQSFFDNMDELDQYTRVIDPDKPQRSDTWRRIALGNHCSLQLTIQDPYHPTDQLPLIRFFGTEKNIKPFQSAWKTFVDDEQKWNSQLSLYKNLKIPLPTITLIQSSSSQNSNTTNGGSKHDDDIACAICYTYKLDKMDHNNSNNINKNQQETPDNICQNQLCNRGFHPTCLFECLRSDPSTTRSFNMLFGKCPYCDGVLYQVIDYLRNEKKKDVQYTTTVLTR
ncbi:unnamed protein product [Cunninghamella blakesleeana]